MKLKYKSKSLFVYVLRCGLVLIKEIIERIQCFCGECEKLETVVTEKWYIFNRRHKVNVLIFKMALSQRMPIYIFGTIPLSLPTFTWFIKTGMSFFTLVMSVLEENQF